LADGHLSALLVRHPVNHNQQQSGAHLTTSLTRMCLTSSSMNGRTAQPAAAVKHIDSRKND
jgi:hypothetical protein